MYSLLLFSSPPPLSVVISSVSQSFSPSVSPSVRPSVMCVCVRCACKKEMKEGREGREEERKGMKMHAAIKMEYKMRVKKRNNNRHHIFNLISTIIFINIEKSMKNILKNKKIK